MADLPKLPVLNPIDNNFMLRFWNNLADDHIFDNTNYNWKELQDNISATANNIKVINVWMEQIQKFIEDNSSQYNDLEHKYSDLLNKYNSMKDSYYSKQDVDDKINQIFMGTDEPTIEIVLNKILKERGVI